MDRSGFSGFSGHAYPEMIFKQPTLPPGFQSNLYNDPSVFVAHSLPSSPPLVSSQGEYRCCLKCRCCAQ